MNNSNLLSFISGVYILRDCAVRLIRITRPTYFISPICYQWLVRVTLVTLKKHQKIQTFAIFQKFLT